MPAKKKKRITIEDLAAMTARGFAETATKEDLKALATKEEIKTLATKEELLATKEELLATKEEMRQGFRSVNARLDLIRQDISDLPVLREKVEDLTARVERLEARQRLK